MRLSASKAIRKKCLDCTCQQSVEVRECTITKCPLWNWRMGYEIDNKGNKIVKRVVSEEQKANMKKNVRKYWEEKKITVQHS